MIAQVVPVAAFDLVVFGATGDLAQRKLLPAMFYRCADGQVPPESRIFGVARSKLDDQEFRDRARQSIDTHVAKGDRDARTVKKFIDRIHYIPADAEAEAGWSDLKKALDEAPDRIRVFYLATSPDLFGPLCQRLSETGLANDNARLVVEKPIGKNLESARALNDTIGAAFPEHHVFRIDHYLGKETVQNLMVLRFANSIWEPVWNNKYVDHVEITAGEELGIELRGRYYEEAGILRDMIQNHVLQLVTLTAMEPPVAFDADAVRDEKLKVLRAIKPILGAEDVAQHVVLGQYAAGSVGGADVPGYRQEKEVAAQSKTPTFVALKLQINNWRWDGVPFYVRSGKRMPKRATEIAVHFKALPHSLFAQGSTQPNVLVVRVQPEEGVALRFSAKVPGERYRPRTVSMDFRYGTAFGAASPEAYERLILDAMRGDQTLFTRKDEVESAWKLIDPILRVIEAPDGPAPHEYEAGSWGPTESDALLARDGRAWRRL